MESTSEKRFRFRLSLKGLLGATTFLGAVLACLRVSDPSLIEKGMVITWAVITVIGVTLAPARLHRLALAGLLCGAIGGCLPALLWYAKYGVVRGPWIEECGYPILALTLAGALTGAAVGSAAWLCARPRRLVVAALACALAALSDYAWWSLAYWHPLGTVQFDPLPQTFAFSNDGQLLASDGETVQTWDTKSGRLRPVQFGKPESVHARSYARMRFIAGDRRYLIAGRWGQNVLHVFAMEDGHEVTSIPIRALSVQSCQFVSEGQLAIVWNDAGHEKIDVGQVGNWDRKETVYDSDRLDYMAISYDRSTVASCGAAGIEITRRGQSGSQRLPNSSALEGIPLMLSPDGRHLASYNRMFDLANGQVSELEKVLGFSPDSTLVIGLSRREPRDSFQAWPQSVRAAPLLHRLLTYGPQYRLMATETSSGRVAARSDWFDGDCDQIEIAQEGGLLMENIRQGRVRMWRIPGRH